MALLAGGHVAHFHTSRYRVCTVLSGVMSWVMNKREVAVVISHFLPAALSVVMLISR